MATTHALAGLLLAILASFVAPVETVGVAAALAGGVFPDLDLYAGHRRTLHFPVYYSVAAAGAVALALLLPGPWTVATALFLAAAALHSASDVFGGGLELRPWEGGSQQAVYSHYHRRWWKPKRWVRYDGAPEDLGLVVLFAIPAVATFDGLVETVVFAIVAVSAIYVLVRKPLVTVAERLVAALPAHLLDRLPQRFVEDFR